MTQGGQTLVNPGQTCRQLNAGEARHGGEARIWSSVDQIDGGDALRTAGELAHRVVVAVPEVAGTDDGELVSGGRSSGAVGFGAAARKRGS